jgi:hypothetical protein
MYREYIDCFGIDSTGSRQCSVSKQLSNTKLNHWRIDRDSSATVVCSSMYGPIHLGSPLLLINISVSLLITEIETFNLTSAVDVGKL